MACRTVDVCVESGVLTGMGELVHMFGFGLNFNP
jgi:hypothetical protein